MRTAFISDLHGNLEALRAVLADIESRDADRILCLGDTVNYGPNPAECLAIVRRLDGTLLGNHEEAVLKEPVGFNPVASAAARWTRSVLEPGFASGRPKWELWTFMGRLPVRHEEGEMLLVHAAPQSPTDEYLLPSDVDPVLGKLSDRLKAAFELVTRVCFVGHTHLPGVFLESGEFLTPADLGGGHRVRDDVKAIYNVGSVGQPRDRDPRACYATYDGEAVRYHRVPYDAEATCAKVRAIRRLPDWCGERLLAGR